MSERKLLLLILLLSGCCKEPYRVSQQEIRSMESQCADKGGLEYITTIGGGRCLNGSYVYGKRGGK